MMQEVRRKNGVSGLMQRGLDRERRVTSYGEESMPCDEQTGEIELKAFDLRKALLGPSITILGPYVSQPARIKSFCLYLL